ncbi:hypothetical protein BW42_01914 [Exiguobacterium sp. RIT341]|nr:hypothetical protein BW42_01914 [Exiguobacterium sp. RIT341]
MIRKLFSFFVCLFQNEAAHPRLLQEKKVPIALSSRTSKTRQMARSARCRGLLPPMESKDDGIVRQNPLPFYPIKIARRRPLPYHFGRGHRSRIDDYRESSD